MQGWDGYDHFSVGDKEEAGAGRVVPQGHTWPLSSLHSSLSNPSASSVPLKLGYFFSIPVVLPLVLGQAFWSRLACLSSLLCSYLRPTLGPEVSLVLSLLLV